MSAPTAIVFAFAPVFCPAFMPGRTYSQIRLPLVASSACTAAKVVGLMTIPPASESPEDARPWFRQLRELRDRWLAEGVPPAMLRELSMGMSADLEAAVHAGSTMVRVGTAVFGAR